MKKKMKLSRNRKKGGGDVGMYFLHRLSSFFFQFTTSIQFHVIPSRSFFSPSLSPFPFFFASLFLGMPFINDTGDICSTKILNPELYFFPLRHSWDNFARWRTSHSTPSRWDINKFVCIVFFVIYDMILN